MSKTTEFVAALEAKVLPEGRQVVYVLLWNDVGYVEYRPAGMFEKVPVTVNGQPVRLYVLKPGLKSKVYLRLAEAAEVRQDGTCEAAAGLHEQKSGAVPGMKLQGGNTWVERPAKQSPVPMEFEASEPEVKTARKARKKKGEQAETAAE